MHKRTDINPSSLAGHGHKIQIGSSSSVSHLINKIPRDIKYNFELMNELINIILNIFSDK